jgi:hypothetical protein
VSNPAFRRIGITFGIGKQKYYGMAIASSEAMYLIMTQTRNRLAQGVAGGLGGALGGLVAGAIASAGAAKAQPIRTCTVTELDPGILTHADWPFKGKSKEKNKQVLVVPRGAVEVVEHPSFTNVLKFRLADTPVTVEYLLFRGAGIRDYLVNTGWPLKWKGRALTAVGA